MVITPILTNELYTNSAPKYTIEEIISITDKYIDRYNFVNIARYSSAILYSDETKSVSMKYVNILYLSYINGNNAEIVVLKNDLLETEYTTLLNLLQSKYLSKVDTFASTTACMLWKNNLNYDKLYYYTVNSLFCMLDAYKSLQYDEKYKMMQSLKVTSYDTEQVIVYFGETLESTITNLNCHITFDDCVELYYIKERMQRDLANGNELVELAEYNSGRSKL